LAFEYIKEADLAQRYKDAQAFMLPLFENLDEYERIARNKPHPKIAKELPKVTDGTLAALIQEQPKRIIQQIPTGKIKANSKWLEVVGGFILTNEIIPNSNSVAALIQKCWAVTSKTLTYGAQPAFVQFINRGEYFGTDFTLPYVKDVFLEPGKLSDRDSNVIFMRAYYQPNQIDAIIEKEKMLKASAKKRNEPYESTWDLDMLESLKTQLKDKDSTALTPNERGKAQNVKGYIEIIHAFQRGIGANFYSFSPVLGDGENVVRRKKNPDPRGFIPIHYMYANIDLSNPLGRGSVEISGGMQNLLDSEVQSYQYMRALMMNPPLMRYGDVVKSTLKYAPGKIWDMGTSPNNKVEIAKLESASLQQFPQNYGLIKSQILNLNSSTDTSISAESGNPGFSKTQAGVKATEQRLGVSDNYMRRQFESWFEEIIETEINLYFAERHGVQELTVDDDTANKLRQIQPESVSPENVIRIDYDSETEKLEFQADPTSSTAADQQEQVAMLKELLADTSADPQVAYTLSKDGWKYNKGEAYREMFQNMGIKNIDKIISKMTDEEAQQAAQAKPPTADQPKMSLSYGDLDGNPQAQQAYLSAAGIELPPEAFQQAQATKDAANTPAATPDEHPVVKLMTSLNIKFTDLGEDTQRWFVQTVMGAPAEAPLPTAVATSAKASDSAVKVAELHHKVDQAAFDNQLKASSEAVKVAQLSHQSAVASSQADQAAKSHNLAETSAKQSHELAVKASNKPTPKPVGAAK
jgi:hypothetical protein